MTGEYGLYNFSVDSDTEKVRHFAATIWDWGNFYQRVLENILTGSKGDFKNSSRENFQFNFWGGIRSKIVDLVINEDIVPVETRRLVLLIKNSLIKRQIHPFVGPIYDTKGTLRIKEGNKAGLEEIRKMNWLCEGVEEVSDREIKL